MHKEWGEHCKVGDRHTLEEIAFHCSEVREGYGSDVGEGLVLGEFLISSCLARYDGSDGDLLGASKGELRKLRVLGVRRLCFWGRPVGRKTIWEKTGEFRLRS